MTTLSIQAAVNRHDGFVDLDGTEMFCIEHFDEIPPFLMSITSDSNLWMYLSSTGGLTAGRVDENTSLFPYETEDRLHRLRGVSGPITLIRASSPAQHESLWEPFDLSKFDSGLERKLYKSPLSNRVVLTEHHTTLGLTFQYGWSSCDEYGFIRTARLTNNSKTAVQIQLLDGLLNILPAGAKLSTTQTTSCLLDAYKRSELDVPTRLGVYSLTATLSDRPEPSESLRANAVWSRGLPGASVLLNEDAVPAFRSGREFEVKQLLTGGRGAYLLQSSFTLAAGASVEWDIIADVALDHLKLEALRQWIASTPDPQTELRAKVAASSDGLKRIVASCDGVQVSQDRTAASHHSANVLFNAMRGGLPFDGYRICVDDFIRFVRDRNLSVYLANEVALNRWPDAMNLGGLIREAERTGVADLIRLAYEYLPLTFGRRHGDPSRPWNRFCIDLKNADGSRKIGYQGNWRDIFQNWEALAFSYPSFIESFVAKFVNASTVDGFNPYRISQDGIDWEVHDPEDPWSNIGYWGDHQIVYLLKLLEASQQFHPGVLQRLLPRPIFSYANVPYRLNRYSLITQNPRNSIHFDTALQREIENRVRAVGADGKLLLDSDGTVYHATLLEKLLVPALSKLSNYVPAGGIWMNTQRPEWNDANNALAGNGVSMVTLYYLRRYLRALGDLIQPIERQNVRLSAEVTEWATSLQAALAKTLNADLSDAKARRDYLDDAGTIFDTYRQKVYANGFSGKAAVQVSSLLDLLDTALKCIDRCITANQREDKLFHAYNLLDVRASHEAKLQHLPEMLEGQVAALSSGQLDLQQSVHMLEALYASQLWRSDQKSFILYPAKKLPSFFDRNIVPADLVKSNPLLVALIDAGDATLIGKDARGQYRFNGDFQHVRDLDSALTKLSRQSRWQSLVVAHRKATADTYEKVFNHHAFTGRSGTMYAYEGLGCVYWHMVAKLLLATQEVYWRAVDSESPLAAKLAKLYYRIRSGLGFNKSAFEYGAVPLDPYSHTPAVGGARQPGMTGQVKEEILTRLGEWGVRIIDGEIHFQPTLLRTTELLRAARTMPLISSDGTSAEFTVGENCAAFTLCQTPVIYHANGGGRKVELHLRDGSAKTILDLRIDKDESATIFDRTGEIASIRVEFPLQMLLAD